MDPVTIGLTAAKYAPAVIAGLRGLRKRKNTDWGAIERYIDKIAPAGATAADYAEGERTTSALNENVDSGDRLARADAMTRAIRRGTLGSSVGEASLQRLDQIRARGRQFARRTGRSQVYQAGLGRQRYREGLLAQVASGRINEMVGNGRLADAASADSLSSALQYLQAIQSFTGGGSPTAQVHGIKDLPGSIPSPDPWEG